MHFDQKKLAAIQQFIEAKWPTPRTCPVCREAPEHWRVSEMPVLLPLLTGRIDIPKHNFARAAESLAVAPAVALTCSNCAHIELFSASTIGVAPVESGDEARTIIAAR